MLTGLERYAEAVTSFDRAISLEPNWQKWGVAYQSLASWVWCDRGYALHRLQREEEAIASFDKALELHPHDADAIYGQAICYGVLGKVARAIAQLEQIIDLKDGEYRELAKTDREFDAMRDDPQFLELLGGT